MGKAMVEEPACQGGLLPSELTEGMKTNRLRVMCYMKLR